MSTSPTYLTDCPRCGQQLQPHAGQPESTPWVCSDCKLGFWVEQLKRDARMHYRSHTHDWGYGDHVKPLRQAVELEIAHAVKRGTSAREDQLSILTVTQLEHIKTRKKIDPEFMKKVDAEHGRRGVK